MIGVGDADVDIYLSVDHIPSPDEKVLARSLAFHPGGMVANFAVAVSRLGMSSGFHGPVGDDEFGRLAIQNLTHNGVNTCGVIVRPGERTYFCVVMLDASGEKALVIAPTPCLFPSPKDLSEELLADSHHLHTTATNVQTLERALALARKHGLTTSVDLEATAAEETSSLWTLLPHVDILFVNRRALASLSSEASLQEGIWALASHGTRLVCVTLGGRGSLVADASGSIEVPAFPAKVVDSTGAGDCFAAAFVYGFLMQWPLEATAAFASGAGALAVQSYGGHGGAPTFPQLQAFLSGHGVALPSAIGNHLS